MLGISISLEVMYRRISGQTEVHFYAWRDCLESRLSDAIFKANETDVC